MNKEKMMIRGLVAEQGVEGQFQQALSEIKSLAENYAAGDEEKMAILALAMTYFLIEHGGE